MSQDVQTRFKQSRVRSEAHLRWIRTLPCSVPGCPRWRTDGCSAHHLTISPDPKARGLKAGDRYAVPLCVMHHDPRFACSVHGYMPGERPWWHALHLDPIGIADKLWAQSPANKG